MQSNPIIEQQQAADAIRREKADYRYPFRLVCVFHDIEGYDFPVVKQTRDYCNENNLIFVCRQYNVDKYEEDVWIKRLPAFHIYYKNSHDETCYYDTNPIHKVQVKVWAFQDEERAKERARQRRKERWDTTIESVKNFFSLERFKKKPALDLDASLSHTRITANETSEVPNQKGTPEK